MKNKVTLNKVLSAQFLREEIKDLWRNGMPEGYKLGLKAIDDLFRFDLGMVAVYTGVPNYGKSEFIDYVCVRLNKRYGLKTLYYSPENFPVRRHLGKLIPKLSNKSFNDLIEEDIDTNMDYIEDNFFFLNIDTVNTLDDILTEAEALIVSNDIKILVIDAYNCLEDQRPSNLTETEYVSQIMTKLQKFSKKYNILINLVVHPKKLQKDSSGETAMPDRYDLAGSANFANKSDYIVIVHRDLYNDEVMIKTEKVKFKNYGTLGTRTIKYDYASGNYFDIEVPNTNKVDIAKQHEEEIYATAMEILSQIDKKDKQKNVLDVSVSYFENVFDKQSKEINLYDYLTDKDKKYYNKYSAIVDCIRNAKTDEERKEIKKNSNLPVITVSCTCGNDKSDIKTINNLICIDIDKKDNLTIIDRVPSLVKQLNCVAYFSKSVSGTGYYCLIPIKHIDLFKQHFNAIQRDFANMGITIDKSCSNPNRLRYYSYDNDAYINTNAEVYTSVLEDKREHKEQNTTNISDIDKTEMLESDKKQIFDMIKYLTTHKIDITKDYDDWLRIGAGIANAFGDKGYILFDRISSISPKYSSYECEDKYDSLLNNPLTDIGLGSVFHIYNKYRKAYEEKNKTSTL